MAVEDLWVKADGTPSRRAGRGLRWRVRVYGRPARSLRTKAAAVAYWQSQMDASGPSAVTVGALLDLWLAGKAGLSQAGRRACADAAAMVRTDWGQTIAAEVTRPDVQAWLAGLTVTVKRRDAELTRPASASTKVKALQALAGALTVGVETGDLQANPARGVTTRPEQPHDPQFLTAAELRALAARAGHYASLVMLLGTTGLRIGEACALDVGDVQTRTVTRGGRRAEVRRLRVRTSKTGGGRDVPIPASVLDLLDVDGRDAGEPLLTSPEGARMSRHNVARSWRRVAPAGLRLHDLRHTAASLAIASGADVKAVQRMLGHKRASMTLDTYGHLWDAGLDDVAAAVDARIRD